MYIEPNTNIRILKDVPLDKTFDHTIYFGSASAQATYFMGLQKYNLNNYTYQRVKRGYARVGIKADNLYDCNYMMFQNTSYGNKWFYAFITSVEYLNNECSQIEFEIDVMQTWFFDYSLDQCFVEREHTVTDNIGIHIEPENVNLGEYVFNDYKDLSVALNKLAVFVAVSDTDEAPNGTVYDGVYGGCTLHAYPLDKPESINTLLTKYAQKPDAVVAMYIAPAIATGAVIPDEGMTIVFSKNAYSFNSSSGAVSDEMKIDGYKPKNKKLYTYPYNFYCITNAGASSLNLRYEFFENLTPAWNITVPMTMPIQCVLRPRNYKGTELNLNETLTLSNYPMCSWSTDAFRAWLAQNALPLVSETGVKMVSGYLGGGVAGATVNTANTVMKALSEGYQASIQADVVRGSINTGNNSVASGLQSFYGGRCSISAQYARMIDDYFTVYGYAVKRLKIPNRNSRPHWNYVKTIGCTITGSIPSDDMRLICSIYDNGITFWKNGSEIGNYSLDNSPQGGE